MLSFKKAVPFKNYMNRSVLIPNAYMLYIFVLENRFSSVIQNEFGTFILRSLCIHMIRYIRVRNFYRGPHYT